MTRLQTKQVMRSRPDTKHGGVSSTPAVIRYQVRDARPQRVVSAQARPTDSAKSADERATAGVDAPRPARPLAAAAVIPPAAPTRAASTVRPRMGGDRHQHLLLSLLSAQTVAPNDDGVTVAGQRIIESSSGRAVSSLDNLFVKIRSTRCPSTGSGVLFEAPRCFRN
jgi:hypothetical protein